MEANQARLHKSDHEITGLGPGNDGTTTQERQEGFEKRETAEQDQVSTLFCCISRLRDIMSGFVR